ncbi:MAG: hypothetical protein ACFFAN_03415 [Promethearchaeota archaeon]
MIDSELIKKKVFKLGADICGIATVSRFDDAPKGFHPCDEKGILILILNYLSELILNQFNNFNYDKLNINS